MLALSSKNIDKYSVLSIFDAIVDTDFDAAEKTRSMREGAEGGLEKSLDYKREELKNDETLQSVYEDKIKTLAGIDVPIESPEAKTEVASE